MKTELNIIAPLVARRTLSNYLDYQTLTLDSHLVTSCAAVKELGVVIFFSSLSFEAHVHNLYMYTLG